MITAEWIHFQISEIDARLATLNEGRTLLEQLRDRYHQLLDIHAGAPNGAGKSGASVAADGGESRSDVEPERARTEPEDTPADGVSDPVARLGSTTRSQRRGHRSTDRESASTAEGSTRTDELTCPECGQPRKNASALGIHRAKAHGVAGRNASARTNGAAAPSGLTPPSPRPGLAHAGADRRDIDELCPRGCGRRFKWEPSLLSHIPGCDGKPQPSQGGGASK